MNLNFLALFITVCTVACAEQPQRGYVQHQGNPGDAYRQRYAPQSYGPQYYAPKAPSDPDAYYENYYRSKYDPTYNGQPTSNQHQGYTQVYGTPTTTKQTPKTFVDEKTKQTYYWDEKSGSYYTTPVVEQKQEPQKYWDSKAQRYYYYDAKTKTSYYEPVVEQKQETKLYWDSKAQKYYYYDAKTNAYYYTTDTTTYVPNPGRPYVEAYAPPHVWKHVPTHVPAGPRGVVVEESEGPVINGPAIGEYYRNMYRR